MISAVLHVQEFDGSHTGEAIKEKFLNMFEKWDISHEQIHIVLRDNGTNIVKALNDASLPHYGCFAHSLILSQRAVTDILARCRKIVGHFRHSCLAYSRLRKIQENLGLPGHRLVQDEPTRWNSSLYMLLRLQEQKMALAAYASEYSIDQLSGNQLDLINKIINALSPIEEVTKSISADAASISVIIPFLRIIRKTLDDHHQDSGICTMKSEMKKLLEKRFAGVERNEKFNIATILDPRFKNKFFSHPSVSNNVKSLVQAHQTETQQVVDATDRTLEEPPQKRQCTTLWKVYSDIIKESGGIVSCEDGSDELEIYLAEPLIDFHRDNVYTWWTTNRFRFPKLASIAQKYLCAPPTSVSSERLFSGAGLIYDESRNRLSPDNAEILLFVKKNFDYLN